MSDVEDDELPELPGSDPFRTSEIQEVSQCYKRGIYFTCNAMSWAISNKIFILECFLWCKNFFLLSLVIFHYSKMWVFVFSEEVYYNAITVKTIISPQYC